MPRSGKNGLPRTEECLVIMKRYGMPDHVVRHSMTVCGVALYLSRALIPLGYDLDLELVRTSALLHDITKRHSFTRPLDHALTGAKLLKRLGWPSIASVVRQHVRLSADRPAGRLSEAEIVNYSDKRVVEDQITSLDERLAYIEARYAKTPEAAVWIRRFSETARILEAEIFDELPYGPARILSIDPVEECERK